MSSRTTADTALVLPPSARELILSGTALAHMTTLNPDGSPQMSVVWAGLDGDRIITGHFGRYRKITNLLRDPRIALSFAGPTPLPNGMHPNLIVYGEAEISEGGAAELVGRLGKVYIAPDFDFPMPPGPPPGYVITTTVRRIAGVGPWMDA
ncbi:pyridoxamine 5'-phosphate oxidase family protein [Actinomycetospora sp. C-140]